MAPVKNGLFSWIHSLLTLSDGLLLPLAGFDGYSTIQSIKLVFYLLLLMAVPSLLVLVPFYYHTAQGDDLSYMSFSILHIRGQQAWVPTAICYMIALITFYFIFVFYRNFCTLRQIFMANPSSLMSFAHLRRVVDDFGSLQDARAYFNISTRAVIISSISADYGPEELKRLLEDAQIGEVESIQQIVPSDEVAQLIKKRSRYLKLLEEELLAFYERLRSAALQPQSPEWRRLSGPMSEAGRSDILDRLCSLPRVSVKERSALICRLLTEPTFMAQYRASVSSEDKLQYYYTRFRACEKELDEALHRFNTFNEDELIRQEHPQPDILTADGYVEKTSLMTLRKALRFGENLSDLRSTLWGSSYAAIVVFKTRRAATLCRQLLLSARLFSLKVSHVPMPDDLIWSNAIMPKADRSQRELLGGVLYVTFNIFFVFITTSLSVATNLDVLKETFPFIKVIVEEHPRFKSVIQGILAPLAFNLSILISPYILRAFLKFQGLQSQSALQSSLMSKYSWFLFFQTCIIGVIFSSFFEIFALYTEGSFGKIMNQIRERMPRASYFFANIIFQRAFIGLMVVLIQPSAVAKKAAFTAFYPASSKTPRVLQAFRSPSSIQPGIIFPEYIVFPYQITMTFLTVTPLSIVPGVLFYSLASLVFKHQFVYSYAVPNESGGEYWRKLSLHLLAGLLMNQIFTVVQFAHDRRALVPTFLMLLLIGLTGAFIPFLQQTFDPVCAHLPMTSEDRRRKRKITQDLVHKQTHLLQVLQPIETAPLVFARIDAEGEDLVDDDNENDDNNNYDGSNDGSSARKKGGSNESQSLASPTETILTLESKTDLTGPKVNAGSSSDGDYNDNNDESIESIRQQSPSINGNNQAQPQTQIQSATPIPVPIVHHSSDQEERLYEVIPLPLEDPLTAATFDTFDVDYLTDRRFLKMPYGHPCMLEHEQALMVPAKLPALMKTLIGDLEKKQQQQQQSMLGQEAEAQEAGGSTTDESPILMGESALSEA